MPDYEIERERVVERPVTERIVEREVPVGRRTIVERRSGAGYAGGFNPVAGLIMVLVVVLLILLVLGVLV